jgi:hypothetical protein
VVKEKEQHEQSLKIKTRAWRTPRRRCCKPSRPRNVCRWIRATIPSGQICLANEARFTSSYASEPLTNYATGWTDTNNIEKTLDFLFPPVQAPRRFEFKKADNTEAFLSETDDLRSIGADFKHVEYKGTTALNKTINKG